MSAEFEKLLSVLVQGGVEKGLKDYEARVLETETRRLRKLAKQPGFTLIPISAK